MGLESIIIEAWEKRAELNTATSGQVREAVETVIQEVDDGTLRVAEHKDGAWVVNQWVKQAILLSFRLNDNALISGPMADGHAAMWYDKVPLKFTGWDEAKFRSAGFRAVPGAMVRRGSFIAPNVVLMPSFVNIGAYVGKGTMVDTWVTIGSCVQIGANCHISGGVGIGGVLEPPGARPVIVEDGAFIGSRAIVVEGVVVEREAVLGAGVVLTASTVILDVTGSEVVEHRGRVPARSVVIPGTRPKRFPAGEFHVPCALIIGRRSESTDRKTSLEGALREHGVSV